MTGVIKSAEKGYHRNNFGGKRRGNGNGKNSHIICIYGIFSLQIPIPMNE